VVPPTSGQQVSSRLSRTSSSTLDFPATALVTFERNLFFWLF
jgi:hypothetical protein